MSYIYTSLEFMSASMFEKTVVGKGALAAATEESLNTPSITASTHVSAQIRLFNIFVKPLTKTVAWRRGGVGGAAALC